MLVATLALAATPALADEPWLETMRAIPIQDGGRTKPLGSYARDLAVELTGRSRWSEGRGPEVYSDRDPMLLLLDMMFQPERYLGEPIIAIENRPFKTKVGLDPMREFFSPMEIANSQGVRDVLDGFGARRAEDSSVSPLPDEKKALALSSAIDRIMKFRSRTPLPIVPNGAGERFRLAGPGGGEPGTEQVQAAFSAFGNAYLAGQPLDAPARALADAIAATGTLPAREAQAIEFELFYNSHQPWRKTAIAYGLSIVVFGLSRLVFRKPLVILAVLLGVWGVVEHSLGIGLRVGILHRAPVSNTYESLLWMGLVGIILGLIAQAFNKKAYYLFGGVCAALLSVLFAGLVPLTDQTNALPAVLRSNYWLIVHVLTIVASYGILLVASVLGHAYLVKTVLLGKPHAEDPAVPIRSHPLTVQIYRCLQIGLFLLTAGTILGGVWAADSWGRFWGWDPKETWALISIVIYFAVLHARYVGWIRDFGLAASSVLGFAAIVWTFYGVNYVMATGLHSYGFGSGGEFWVGLWAVAEIAFLIACKVRHRQLTSSASIGKPARVESLPKGAEPRPS